MILLVIDARKNGSLHPCGPKTAIEKTVLREQSGLLTAP